MECIEAQRAEGDAADLVQILLQKGYLKAEQVKQLKEAKPASRKEVASPSQTRPRTGTTTATPRQPPTAQTSAVKRATSAAPAVARKTGQQPAADTASRKPTAQAPAVGKPTRQSPAAATSSEGKPTSVTKKTDRRPGTRSTTAVRKATHVAPALSDPSMEGTGEPPRASRSKGLVIGLSFAGIPMVLLIAFLIIQNVQARRLTTESKKPPTSNPSTGVLNNKSFSEEDGDTSETVVLFRIDDGSDLGRRWNGIVAELGEGGPEMYARSFKQIQLVVADAKGTKHEKNLQGLYKRMLRAIKSYGETIFSFLAEQSATLAKAGKYSEAVSAWDWFPNVVDPLELFRVRIEDAKKATRRAGSEFYANLKEQAEKHAAAGHFEDAKRLMMQALEIGFPEVTEEAFKKVADYSSRESEASRKAEEEALKRYEKEVRDQKEAGAVLDAIRSRFWELVTQRKPEAVEAFLKSEKANRPSEPFSSEFRLFDQVFARVRDLVDTAGAALRSRLGQTVTLSFVDQVRTVRLKEVGGGKLTYIVEGRELAESLWRLHASELSKLAGNDPARQAAAHLLADEFDRASESAAQAGETGRPIAVFVEGSASYVLKNEAKIRDRARKLETDRQYEKAAREYSKLVAVPSLRPKALKDRARAYFQAENFVAAVLDVEHLFELDVVDREAIDILNKSYERSALISKAVAIYEKAAKKLPEDAHVLAALVALYMKIHEYGKAREALANARKLKNWDPSLVSSAHLLSVDEKGAFPGKSYKIQLDRYIVETDIAQKFTNEIAQFMGEVYRNYKKVFPYKKNENLHFYVKIFATESEFATYYKAVTGTDIAKGHGKVLAYYMPLTKELVGWNAPDLKSTLMHEGLHQFIDFYVDDCPNWFNEGFACIFETSTAEEVKFNAERHQLAKAGMARKFLPSLRDLLQMTRQKWNASEYTVYYYGQSWSFIYWMIKQGRRDILDKYFDELMKGRTAPQAFDSVFGTGKVNLDELEAKWRLAVFKDNYD